MDDAARVQRNQYQNDWYHAHKDEVLASQKRYRDENADAINARRATYRAEHRAELAEAERTRRQDPEVRRRHREETERRRRWFTRNLRLLRETQGCADCGTHEGDLDHHHLDPATKRCSVSKMHRHSLRSFLDEIAKCVVLCDVCHTKRHWAMTKASWS